MPHPIAELDGDEMTHVLWGKIKEQLILPFVELNTEYYDLGLPNRERTADQVTQDAAEAIRRLHIGVKCATITPNLQRQEEYGLSQLWKSPNATIRAALDGTVFRAPILISRVKPVVTSWKKPVTIARKGVMQWMHRHNRSVGSLRLEVLLEKNGNDSNLKSSLIEVSGQSFPIKNSCISSRNIPLDQYIKGAILSFPDGVSISIRETTPSALMKLFELYTQVTGNPNV